MRMDKSKKNTLIYIHMYCIYISRTHGYTEIYTYRYTYTHIYHTLNTLCHWKKIQLKYESDKASGLVTQLFFSHFLISKMLMEIGFVVSVILRCIPYKIVN